MWCIVINVKRCLPLLGLKFKTGIFDGAFVHRVLILSRPSTRRHNGISAVGTYPIRLLLLLLSPLTRVRVGDAWAGCGCGRRSWPFGWCLGGFASFGKGLAVVSKGGSSVSILFLTLVSLFSVWVLVLVRRAIVRRHWFLSRSGPRRCRRTVLRLLKLPFYLLPSLVR